MNQVNGCRLEPCPLGQQYQPFCCVPLFSGALPWLFDLGGAVGVVFFHFGEATTAAWPSLTPLPLQDWSYALLVALGLAASIVLLRVARRLRRDVQGLRAANERLQTQFQSCQVERYRCEVKDRSLQAQAQYWRSQYQKLPFPAYTWHRRQDVLVLADCNEAAIARSQGAVFTDLGQATSPIFSDPEQVQQAVQACWATGRNSQGPLHTLEAGGRTQDWQAHYCYLEAQGVLLVLQDTTTAQALAVAAERYARQQTAAVRLSRLGLRALVLEDYLQQVAVLAAETLGVNFSQVLELLPNESAFLLRAGCGWPESTLGSATMTAAASSFPGYVRQGDRPVRFDDLPLETRFRGSTLLHNGGVASGLGVPIHTTQGFYGVLGVYADWPEALSDADEPFLQLAAAAIASAVERDRQQAQLRLLERAINASSNGIFISDALASDAALLYVNPGFERLTGYSASDALGQSIHFLAGPDTDPQPQRELRAALFRGSEFHASLRYYRQDGSEFWNDLYIAPVRDAQGYLTHFIGVQTDITERKRVEAALRSERDLLNGIMQTSVAAIVVLDARGRITFANDQAEKLLGLTPSELEAHSYNAPTWKITDFEGRPFPEEQLPFVQVLATGRPVFSVRQAIEWPDGSRRYLSINGAPLQDESGAIASVVCSVTDITDQFYSEQALRQSEEQFRHLFALAPIGMMLASLDGRILQTNPALCEALEYQAQELLDRSVLDLTHPEDRAVDFATTQQMLLGEITDYKLEKRLLAKSGRVVHALLQVVLLTDDHGNPSHTLSQIVDITEHKQAEAALWLSEQRLEGILDSIDDVVWSSSAETFTPLYLNPGAERIYGRAVDDFFLNPTLWLDAIHPEDRPEVLQKIETFKQQQNSLEAEYRIQRPDGTERWLYTRCRLVRDEHGRPVRVDGISNDVTERKQAEAQLRHSAFYDALTDLPNRSLFIDRLWHTIRRAKRRQGYLFAVLFLDLDSFKVINDSLGHDVGDRLLVAIARRLEGCLRPSDTLARLGGDEFAVLLEELQQNQDAAQVAKTIAQELQRPFKIAGQEIYTNASIGIALSCLGEEKPVTFGEPWPVTPTIDYEQPEDLLRDADTAMYRAKFSGKGRYAIFDRQMHEQAIARLRLETDLRHAFERGEFSLHYQPIVSLVTHNLAGFEALLRWQHPQQGRISPVQFIPIAEEIGLIIPLGQWVLREAARQLHRWQTAYPQHHSLTVSVNLSSKQLREPSLLDQIDTILRETELDYASLRLEVTESMLMENAEAATKLLCALRDRHIQIGIDDFGTGYSSLSYLHRLPAHTLKIDRSFVARMNPDGSNAEIVRAIITLAHALDMEVVAEGIETVAQLQHLRQLGCEYGQGYFLAPPLPPEAAEAMIVAGLSPVPLGPPSYL